ncbi:MAG: ATP-binding protein [Pseudomonadota bacterium]
MRPPSLTVRILTLAALAIAAALIFIWLLLTQLFESQITARYFAELEGHLQQLGRAVELDREGAVYLGDEMGEPRFERPFSGLYWQIIGDGDAVLLTSDSLWDETLEVPDRVAAEPITRHARLAFGDAVVMAIERTVLIGGAGTEFPVRLVVALDRTELTAAMDAFDGRVKILAALVGLFLMIAAGVLLMVGLGPLRRLRTSLAALRTGTAARLDGPFPSEIQGVADELNRVLDARDEMIDGARARAADLAHGLKTPLAVLGAESRSLAARGDTETAAAINAEIDRMHRNVERELIRARVGLHAGADLRMPIAPSLDRLVRALGRLPVAEGLDWEVSVPAGLEVAMDPTDFEEVAGNLLDNACKWAASRIAITAHIREDCVDLSITDDGPGVPDAQLHEIVERGRRLDQATPGTGLGLTIARDILDLYGGELRLDHVEPSGLLAHLTLPAPRSIPA